MRQSYFRWQRAWCNRKALAMVNFAGGGAGGCLCRKCCVEAGILSPVSSRHCVPFAESFIIVSTSLGADVVLTTLPSYTPELLSANVHRMGAGTIFVCRDIHACDEVYIATIIVSKKTGSAKDEM